MRTGGALLVACLEAQGVTTSFGVPGESYLSVLDGLHDSGIRYVPCRQEGGVAYAASAWGKLTGTPGIGLVSRGPGATNAAVGLHTAMQDSSPMILFVGQAGTTSLGREAFQEVDYRSFFAPLVKWVTQVEHADRLPEVVSRAFSTARSGRPGPVVVALPEDVLEAGTEVSPGRAVRIGAAAPTPSDSDAAMSLLAAAHRPLLLVGGGGWSSVARHHLRTFAESNSIPVASAFRFHDLLDNESPCYIGDAGVAMAEHVRDAMLRADLLVAVGVRFGEMTTAGYSLLEIPDPARPIVHVHPSDQELGRIVQADLPIVSSPEAFLDAVSRRELPVSADREAWCRETRARRQRAIVAPSQPGPVDMGQIMTWLQEELPGDVIITNGAGNFSIWPNKHFSFGEDARLLAPQSGSMGYGLPAAIAAKIAEPDRTVVCFTGDGDIQMTIQELGTAMQERAQPIVIVVNNRMYGTIRMHQERAYPDRVSGTDLENPDFVMLAHAYGFHAERVEATADFADAFGRAAASSSGALLELVVSP